MKKFFDKIFNKGNDEIIVSKSEVEAEIRKETKLGKNKEEEEPTFFHYTIIILFFIIGGIILYQVLNFFDSTIDPNSTINNSNKPIQFYDYSFIMSNGKSAKIQFYAPPDSVKNFNYPIEISKIDLLNSKNIYLSFMEYNGSDNGEISRTSLRLVPFLRDVLLFSFDVETDLYKYENLNCQNSSVDNKVIVFNPYSDKTGVFYDGEGCIEFLTQDPKDMRYIGDKFFYTLINE